MREATTYSLFATSADELSDSQRLECLGIILARGIIRLRCAVPWQAGKDLHECAPTCLEYRADSPLSVPSG